MVHLHIPHTQLQVHTPQVLTQQQVLTQYHHMEVMLPPLHMVVMLLQHTPAHMVTHPLDMA